MVGLLREGFVRRKSEQPFRTRDTLTAMPTIEDVQMTLPDWEEVHRDTNISQWQNEIGDGFSLNFFPMSPDIVAPLEDVDGVRSFYRSMIVPAGLGLVGCEVIEFQGLPAVELIAKAPMDPTGFVFLGSISIPFKNCSYVLKYQAMEGSPTGLREAMVTTLACPDPKVDGATCRMLDWFADPYDPTLEYEVMRSRADDEEWDSQFPDHPLSRLRRNLNELKVKATMAKSLHELPRFGV